MDLTDPDHGFAGSDEDEAPTQARQLPSDLPTSLDDRRTVNIMNEETEMYDAWQGMCLIARAMPAAPL